MKKTFRRYTRCQVSHRGTVAVMAFVVSGCAITRVQPISGRSLVELDDAAAAAWESRDADRAMDFWAESAVMYVPDHPALHGRAAIRELLERSHSAPRVDHPQSAPRIDRRPSEPRIDLAWTPTCAGVDEHSSMAYTLGDGQISIVDGSDVPRTRHARYVAIWRKEGDRWRCAVKSWTPTPPSGTERP